MNANWVIGYDKGESETEWEVAFFEESDEAANAYNEALSSYPRCFIAYLCKQSDEEISAEDLVTIIDKEAAT